MSDKHDRTVKQVIIWNKSLKCRTGKIAAQCSHASMAFLTKFAELDIHNEADGYLETFIRNPFEVQKWITEGFTKVVCQCENEEELKSLYQKALDAGLNAHLIIDSGFTEFHGVPTPTCVGIGPNKIEEIDKITGHLKLM
jgi:PTH2 family peptidyl-tRNA hydrolase